MLVCVCVYVCVCVAWYIEKLQWRSAVHKLDIPTATEMIETQPNYFRSNIKLVAIAVAACSISGRMKWLIKPMLAFLFYPYFMESFKFSFSLYLMYFLVFSFLDWILTLSIYKLLNIYQVHNQIIQSHFYFKSPIYLYIFPFLHQYT